MFRRPPRSHAPSAAPRRHRLATLLSRRLSRRLSRHLSRRGSCPVARRLRPEAKATLFASTLGYLLFGASFVAAAAFVDHRLTGDRTPPAVEASAPQALAASAGAGLGNDASTAEATAVSANTITTPMTAMTPATAATPATPTTSGRRAGPPAFNPQRFLLNALLAPALDPDSDPPTWTDPRPALGCEPASSVRIDGRPLEAGAKVPSGQFIMDWQAHHCRPFGLHGPRFDGAARLIVSAVGEAWTAVVLPDGMAITRPDGRTLPLSAGRARMPLGAAPASRLLARDDRQAVQP